MSDGGAPGANGHGESWFQAPFERSADAIFLYDGVIAFEVDGGTIVWVSRPVAES